MTADSCWPGPTTGVIVHLDKTGQDVGPAFYSQENGILEDLPYVELYRFCADSLVYAAFVTIQFSFALIIEPIIAEWLPICLLTDTLILILKGNTVKCN